MTLLNLFNNITSYIAIFVIGAFIFSVLKYLFYWFIKKHRNKDFSSINIIAILSAKKSVEIKYTYIIILIVFYGLAMLTRPIFGTEEVGHLYEKYNYTTYVYGYFMNDKKSKVQEKVVCEIERHIATYGEGERYPEYLLHTVYFSDGTFVAVDGYYENIEFNKPVGYLADEEKAYNIVIEVTDKKVTEDEFLSYGIKR